MHVLRPLAVTLALTVASFATLAAPATPLVVAAPAATPATLEAGTDAIFARWNRSDSPGCGVAVFRDGAIALQKGYGQANLELGVPIGADTVFDIGSTSKQFTAAALLLLERDGKLSLDDDVRTYVPELPDYGQAISLRQLLQHTSGLRDYLEVQLLAGVAYDDYSSDRQTLELLSKQKALNFAPGSEFVYSNTGYFLAAEIVKRVSGKPLAQFARERIFEPLGMRDTLFRDDHTLPVRGRASAYARAEGAAGQAPAGIARFRIDMPNWDQVGDGAVLSTLADLQRWDENFYRPTVGDAEFLARLQQPGRLADGTPLDYALGLFVDTHRGLKTVSHDGAWGGYRAQLLRFPERHLSVATLCNLGSTDPDNLALQVADLWLGLPPEPATQRPQRPQRPSVDTPAAAMQRWAGVYRNPATGSLRRIEWDDGTLSLHAFGDTYAMRPVGKDEFEVDGGPVAALSFRDPGRGRPRVAVQLAGGKRTEFPELQVAKPDAAALAGYAGDYRCDELGRDYRFSVIDGALHRDDSRTEPARLQPLERDRFLQGSLSFRFQRDAAGAIDGVSMDVGRVRDLRCQRR
ncbi:CubicO group peptidase, beta-lactamase class C family [Lysobacter sp. yr284]|uniref:serine hydrolase n=1 Tax=Lysobacter sp. yr284 TaxID=1761791 RepID=UPI0008970040|nr:serine hydrolase [Lysobacter sp. yr284]SDZ09201.1 CubicO group peptidase, beta-lactamase class C family [Lysobacter sp. yr284]